MLIEGRLIQSHAQKNKIVAERWHQMLETEKVPRAKEDTCGNKSQPEKSWKEASRIIRNLESNVCINIPYSSKSSQEKTFMDPIS